MTEPLIDRDDIAQVLAESRLISDHEAADRVFGYLRSVLTPEALDFDPDSLDFDNDSVLGDAMHRRIFGEEGRS